MANSGQMETAALVAMLSERAAVKVRLALVADAQQWRLHHGQVTLDDDAPLTERAWCYSTATFLELRLPGPTVAALLRGDDQDVHGLHVVSPGPPSSSASTQRLRGQEEWGRVTTPWPRTEWAISRDTSTPQPGYGLLVGDGPSFLNFDQALSAFLHQRPHDSTANSADLWRIVLPQRAGWFPQITIGPDLLTAVVDGEALDGAVLELSWAAGNQLQSVDGAGTYRFAMPHGLAHDSLLVLRREDRWLDWRSFPAPSYGRARDASVVWEQPGPELDLLLANGEGQHLECKREVPEGDSRKKMLKTIAAFASQDGGTVLIGVQDDLQIVGLPEGANVDKQVLQVVGMIRDNLEPVPAYEPRVIDHDGKKVLAIEVSGRGQMYAYRNGQRPEFYVRVGPNTVPARHHEIAAGFRQAPTVTTF
ncbi:AlbA family DNA-binding domain-containing protein [Streptomyces ipomoeae]|uniref:Divergent AAA domain protein n=1 Tax=Streptomyces ipomoeae 91-03 TaxID=698759 RepID=L1KK19_9ACTN|nr:ATP-binding protein [Streptomyces ipomoeae]EKX60909.1 divergent AAA domain protein [Streptomyces ipomoeae 91-03]MDX2697812.1 ATP-binding protein [Streptomyces ipomoeae]MDX2843639.1 ATP-binding protein [Streptomyces ipomoeae]